MCMDCFLYLEKVFLAVYIVKIFALRMEGKTPFTNYDYNYEAHTKIKFKALKKWCSLTKHEIM